MQKWRCYYYYYYYYYYYIYYYCNYYYYYYYTNAKPYYTLSQTRRVSQVWLKYP